MTYPPGDVKSLCDVLMGLVASGHARKELGEKAREAVQKQFSFHRMLEDFEGRILAS